MRLWDYWESDSKCQKCKPFAHLLQDFLHSRNPRENHKQRDKRSKCWFNVVRKRVDVQCSHFADLLIQRANRSARWWKRVKWVQIANKFVRLEKHIEVENYKGKSRKLRIWKSEGSWNPFLYFEGEYSECKGNCCQIFTVLPHSHPNN